MRFRTAEQALAFLRGIIEADTVFFWDGKVLTNALFASKPHLDAAAFTALTRQVVSRLVHPSHRNDTAVVLVAPKQRTNGEGDDDLVDLHTGGLAMRIVPMCGYMLVDGSAVLDNQRGMAKAFGLPDVWGHQRI